MPKGYGEVLEENAFYRGTVDNGRVSPSNQKLNSTTIRLIKTQMLLVSKTISNDIKAQITYYKHCTLTKYHKKIGLFSLFLPDRG